MSEDDRHFPPRPGDRPAAALINRNSEVSRAAWRGEVKRIGDLAESEIALWRRIVATRYEFRSPFFSFEFARAVAEAGADARVCLLHDGWTLAGFFPFQFADRFARSMAAGERIGGELNDFCGVVLDRSAQTSINVKHLLRCAGLESFEVSHLEETQPQIGLSSSMASQGARIKLEGDPQRYWQTIRSNHPSRHDTLRNRERKIKRDFRSVDFVFAHDDPIELLKLVVAEKRKQYQRTGAEDGFAGAWKLPCLERIGRYREGRCVPVLSSLFLDGIWAALHFGVRADNVLHYWFPVYNDQYAGLSPGLVLLKHMIDEAAGHGIAEIDLGEGLSRYKVLFATELYSVYRDFWHRASPRGIAYRGLISLMWRVQARRRKE